MTDSTLSAADVASRRARLIAYYLPQFHPVPENDEWWGKGFTEWTNVAKAKPLFPGHYQPRVPADLGFYDLRVPETRIAQAEMARSHGIEGFCYWHYWFAGRRILERPFEEVLASGQPDFPFCLGWANHTWSGIWYGEPKRILIEQTYPGREDDEAHFRYLMKAFADRRYIRVDDKPIFFIFQPKMLPDPVRTTDYWREMMVREGFKGIHIVGITDNVQWNPTEHGFDAVTISNFSWVMIRKVRDYGTKLRRRLRANKITGPIVNGIVPQPLHVYNYEEIADYIVHSEKLDYEYYPCVLPNWDNTPRSGLNGMVLHESSPEVFGSTLERAIDRVAELPRDHRIVVIKSWNEWAEGNHLEPDLRYGKAYLDVVKRLVAA